MLSKKMEEALNNQMGAEIFSSYLYLSMASWAKGENLPGFASWLEAQTEEEMTHAMKFYHFLDEREGTPRFGAIEAPDHEWKSPLHLFEEVLAHEKKVTALIHELVVLAREEKDLATEFFLQWFVNEQVEEEASALQVVNDLKRLGDNHHGIFMIDRELGQRGPASAILAPPAGE